ncbi:hypothetical protein [Muribaculum intestinale]|uniref:hypothetical protein n=1 Tax=Muribaculum intestinale TaxID=1796646 RepID=UPI0025B6DFE4|nr:hypothetical protein [Muribaculum intestinale]
MKKLFRFHRGSLAESLDTTIEVSGFAEVLEKVMETYGDSISNIKIKKEGLHDPRLPEDWNELCFYVVADCDGYKEQCIGMSNFYESGFIQAGVNLGYAVDNFMKLLCEPVFKSINKFVISTKKNI